jgi:hypothetical protein
LNGVFPAGGQGITSASRSGGSGGSGGASVVLVVVDSSVVVVVVDVVVVGAAVVGGGDVVVVVVVVVVEPCVGAAVVAGAGAVVFELGVDDTVGVDAVVVVSSEPPAVVVVTPGAVRPLGFDPLPGATVVVGAPGTDVVPAPGGTGSAGECDATSGASPSACDESLFVSPPVSRAVPLLSPTVIAVASSPSISTENES